MPIQMGDLTVYTVEELAVKFSLKETTIRKYLKEKKLPGKRLGKRWYISEDSLKDLFQETEPDQKPSD